MVRASPRLQSDVNEEEEAEQRRLECGSSADPFPLALSHEGANVISVDGETNGDVAALLLGTAGDTGASVVQNAGVPSHGTVVQGAAQRRDQLVAKMFSQGGFREAAKISDLLPHGSAGLKTKLPKRKDFGEEGGEGDAAHEAAMKEFSIKEFGSTHVEGRTIDRRMRNVGLFGYWLEQNNFGKYLEWQVKKRKKKRSERCMIACERDGHVRVPSDAAMMEYVLSMATGDSASRPKGGWAEYHLGEHVEPALHGKRKGEMMGKMKEFGTGSYADGPFRYRSCGGIESVNDCSCCVCVPVRSCSVCLCPLSVCPV